jgi:hypothetical protein
MTFSTQKLAGNRTLVTGTDINGIAGSTVVFDGEWEGIKRERDAVIAENAFNDATTAFYAPLTAAAEALEAAKQGPAEDPLFSVTIEEPTAASHGTRGHVHRLGRDSVILRAIEEGQADRLIWVSGELELLADAPVTAAPLPTGIVGE